MQRVRIGIHHLKKSCNICNEIKELKFFPISKKNNDGRQGQCKKCKAKWMREDRIKNPKKYREFDLKQLYGIDLETYNKLSEFQCHVCAICGGKENTKNKNLHIDHDHKTGKIRGLLCGNCNYAIGHLKEDISILKSAIRYLEGGQ